MDARMVTLYKVEYKFAASEKKRQDISKRRKFMFRNYVFTFSVVSLLVMGHAVTAYAADDAAPPYPNWAAAVVPAYPHARPLSSPIAARVQSKMYGLATTDQMPAVVAWYKARVKGAWSPSEGGATWSIKSGGLRIQISRNFYDDSGNEKPGTRVALTRYH
jgi:hypothetical protein